MLGVAWFAVLATALIGATAATLIDLAPGTAVSDICCRSRGTGGDVMGALLSRRAAVLVLAVVIHPLVMRAAARRLEAAIEQRAGAPRGAPRPLTRPPSARVVSYPRGLNVVHIAPWESGGVYTFPPGSADE